MKGIAARTAMAEHKNLDFIDGYDLLLGGTPQLRQLRAPEEHNLDGMPWLKKQILTILNSTRNAEMIPSLLDDIHKRMDGWGQEGLLNPFKSFPDIAFQTIIRVSTCSELASDPEAVAKLRRAYSMMEKSASVTLLLSWLPTKAKRDGETANEDLRSMLRTYVEMRKTATTPGSDAIDLLLSKGLPDDRIVNVEFQSSCLIRGINFITSDLFTVASWILIFLASNVEWKTKIVDEINSIIEKYASDSTTEPIHKRLATIPLSAWEEEMPMFDLVLQETLRLTVAGVVPRRSIVDNLELLGKRIPKGSFVVYQTEDVHMDPEVYTDPTQFDPARLQPGREEDKKVPYAFLSWGAGRHSCPGMKFAKLDLKLMVSLFLTTYEYDLANENGASLKRTPKPNYEDFQIAQPNEQVFYKFKRRKD
ncbi:hypothetical protein H0H93_010695 [Arthromyces matolae]|nr:hypothetical protein H0H93_010695 [Arthromyces matolae]